MSVLRDEVEQFYKFAAARAQVGDIDSLQRLLDLWYAEQSPTTGFTGSIVSSKQGADPESPHISPADKVIEGLHREIANDE